MTQKDPLTPIKDQQRELFGRLSQTAHGFHGEDVVGAALNMIVNVLRQSHPKRDTALRHLDELLAQARQMTAAQYALTGARLNGAYPFDQRIEMPLVDFAKDRKW